MYPTIYAHNLYTTNAKPIQSQCKANAKPIQSQCKASAKPIQRKYLQLLVCALLYQLICSITILGDTFSVIEHHKSHKCSRWQMASNNGSVEVNHRCCELSCRNQCKCVMIQVGRYIGN